ncbi:MAG: hypothetical protein RL326_263 [Pseudomonadota bacterium]
MPVNDSSSEYSVTSLEELRAKSGAPVRRITLSTNLTEVPREILDHAPHIEFLDLSHNKLDQLPDWLGQLPSLEILFLSYNKFVEVPAVIGRCRSLRMLGMRNNVLERISEGVLPPSLEWLTLTNNRLEKIPESSSALKKLTKLLLAGNRLTSLPHSMRDHAALELIRLSANRFEEFPEWLFKLPALAWIALAGNPAVSLGATSELERIEWGSLTAAEELGRGASGVTYRARLRNEEDVAVKLFSSSVSSDGATVDEVAAAVHAGSHRSIVSTIGAISGHPEGKAGLVLRLIPPTFKNLAEPPSFDTCTRDVYRSTESLSESQVVRYARDIASAAAHLHERGILHGDLYAHNILVDGERALLSDFGAACLYGVCSNVSPTLLERLEVNAFGILMGELLDLVPLDDQGEASAEICALVSMCVAPDVLSRPSFSDVQQRLTQLRVAFEYEDR